MSDYSFQLLAIVIYMLAMIIIGWYAYKRTTNLNDYMLGGRDLGPAVTALSAGAADMSGWLLMGLPGAIYAAGIVEAWIAIGLTVGAWLNWLLVAPRLRVYT
ncbi:sodium:proline symporter, partial [Lysinibacillus sp. BW-2-10]